MLERIRNMSRNLRPPELDTLDILGLFAALQMYSKQQADAAGWVLHFDAPRLERPPRAVELACFHVVQDGLANIAQNANASEVWLTLRISADELQLSLRDNGTGFNAAKVHERADRRSRMLTGMEDRVREVGGSMEIKSNPGSGTEIHALFPRSVQEDRLQT
jgi:signal transduction histidine kinase